MQIHACKHLGSPTQKTVYDGLGRVVKQYLTDDAGGFAQGTAQGLLLGQSLGESLIMGLEYGGQGAMFGAVVGGLAPLVTRGVRSVNPSVAAETQMSLRLAPESQGGFEITPKWENVPARMWADFPEGVPRPTGAITILEGEEYSAARTLANRMNVRLSRIGELGPKNFDIHEITPVKFGGSPTAGWNKFILPEALHTQATTWFNRFLRWFKS